MSEYNRMKFIIIILYQFIIVCSRLFRLYEQLLNRKWFAGRKHIVKCKGELGTGVLRQICSGTDYCISIIILIVYFCNTVANPIKIGNCLTPNISILWIQRSSLNNHLQPEQNSHDWEWSVRISLFNWTNYFTSLISNIHTENKSIAYFLWYIFEYKRKVDFFHPFK